MLPYCICGECGTTFPPERFTIRQANGRRAVLYGNIECPRGCEPPDRPGELTREDRRWMQRHMTLIREWASLERKLVAGAWDPELD